VKDRNVGEADRVFDVLDRLLETLLGADVIACGEKMGRVEARAGIQRGDSRDEVGNFFQR